MKTARIENNIVAEIIPEAAHPVEYWYNAEFAAKCQEIPDEVMPNWGWDPEQGKWLPEHEYKTLQEKLHRVFNQI